MTEYILASPSPLLYPRTQQLVTRMTSYGRIREFHPEEETIESYLERIELFFTANEIADGKMYNMRYYLNLEFLEDFVFNYVELF